MIENKERKAATSLKAFNDHWSSKNGKAIGGKLHEGPLCQMQYVHLDDMWHHIVE
jgi:hypothetical protein